MRSSSQLLLALAGVTSIAVADPLAHIIPQITAGPVVARRQQSSITTESQDQALVSECTSAFDSLYTNRPTAGNALAEWLITGLETSTTATTTLTHESGMPNDLWANPIDLDEFCKVPFIITVTPPAELAEDFTSYTSNRESWKTASGSVLRSYVSKCSEVDPPYAGQLLLAAATDMKECKMAATLMFGLQNYAPATATSDGGAISASSSTGAAPAGPRETGYVGALAFAAVGALVGAAAV